MHPPDTQYKDLIGQISADLHGGFGDLQRFAADAGLDTDQCLAIGLSTYGEGADRNFNVGTIYYVTKSVLAEPSMEEALSHVTADPTAIQEFTPTMDISLARYLKRLSLVFVPKGHEGLIRNPD